MAMKIRIEILSGWPISEVLTLLLRTWQSRVAQPQLITSSQSLPFNAIQSPPECQGNSFRGLQRLCLALTVAYLFFQMLVPHARMMHVGSLMDGNGCASPGISAVHLSHSPGFLPGDPRRLRFIRIKSSQRLLG